MRPIFFMLLNNQAIGEFHDNELLPALAFHAAFTKRKADLACSASASLAPGPEDSAAPAPEFSGHFIEDITA